MPDLNININKDSVDGENPQNPVSVGEQPRKVKEQGKKSLTQNAIGVAIVQAGKQMVINGVSQFGNMTGDYTVQRNIQSSTKAIGDVITVAKFGVAGAIFVGATYATEAFNSFVGLENTRREEAQRRERAGAISIKGSRY